MTSRLLSAPLFALALSALVAGTAFAQDAAPAGNTAAATAPAGDAGAPARKSHPRYMPTPDELSKLEAMTPQERKAYRKEQNAKFDAMSDEEKAKFLEEKRAAYNALPEDQKKALRERYHALHGKGGQKNPALAGTGNSDADKASRRAQWEAFENSLTPEQKAKFEALKNERHTAGKAGGFKPRDAGSTGAATSPAATDTAK